MEKEAIVEESTEGLRARPQSGCFVCGQENPRGLRMRFHQRHDGEVTAEWTPSGDCEGFSGIVHGGLVSTVLDEAMSKTVAATGTQALTAELRVRFRRHVASGATFHVRAWIVRRKGRLVEAEATLFSPDGTERAHAWSSFLALPAGA